MSFQRDTQLGFTLLEVIVAFAIAAITLGILSQIFGQGARNLALAEDYDSALTLANSLLTEYSTTEIDEEASYTEHKDQFQWTVSIEPYSVREATPILAPSEAPLTAERLRLIKINVDVAWRRHTTSRSINLSSLRLVRVDSNGRAF